MRGQRRSHMSAHIWEHRGAHIWGPKSGNHTWCEPEEAKSTGTCQKSHFVWKFTGKMPHPLFGARTLCGNLQEKTRTDMAQEPFCVEIYRKNAGPPGAHLDETRAPFTLTVRTPSVWPQCLGKNVVWRATEMGMYDLVDTLKNLLVSASFVLQFYHEELESSPTTYPSCVIKIRVPIAFQQYSATTCLSTYTPHS